MRAPVTAALAAALLVACGQGGGATPSAEPARSATPGRASSAPSGAASAVAPLRLAPPGPGASRAAREQGLRELFEGKRDLGSLPLRDVSPGRAFDPRLRSALSARGSSKLAKAPDALRPQLEAAEDHVLLCYRFGLGLNPTLMGGVSVSVGVLGGKVATVGHASSDLPDSTVIRCVVEEVRVALGLPRVRPLPPGPPDPWASQDEKPPAGATIELVRFALAPD